MGWFAAMNTCKSGGAISVGASSGNGGASAGISAKNGTASGNQKQTITFKNNAGYVAEMTVMYMVNQQVGNGYAPIPRTDVTGKLAVGQSKILTLPASLYKEGQINVWIKGVATTKQQVMSKTLSPNFVDNACFEAKGTIFNAHGDYCGGGAPLIKPVQNSGGQTAEQRCYGMVQNNVAWNTKEDKSWQNKNVKSLCQGVRAGQEQVRINCFSGVMPALGWSAAIKQCKK